MESRSPMEQSNQLSMDLANKAIKYAGSRLNEIEKYCWMIVHEYRHGVMPVEYDIREIDEDLYMDVLNCAKRTLTK